MTWLVNLISAKGGSTLRLVMLWSFFVVTVVWGVINVNYVMNGGTLTNMIDVPEHVMELLSVVVGGKVWQRSIEKKSTTSTATTTATTTTT